MILLILTAAWLVTHTTHVEHWLMGTVNVLNVLNKLASQVTPLDWCMSAAGLATSYYKLGRVVMGGVGYLSLKWVYM